MKTIDKIRELYVSHCAGGNLHIVLDDGNIANSHIIFCLGEAIKEKDWLCVEICYDLLNMKWAERQKLYNNYGNYA
jgi:hypothetical protein